MQEVKSNIEVVLSNDYINFLAVLFEPLCNVLRTVPPQSADNPQHKLRSSVLDLLSKMPQSEVFKPRVIPLFDVSLSVLISDNQENALVATKTLLDLQKAFRGTLQVQAAQLLDHIVKVRGHFPSPEFAGDGEQVESISCRSATFINTCRREVCCQFGCPVCDPIH